MKKIAVIRTSPRRAGNTNILCDAFISGAKESSQETEFEDINLNDYAVNYCQGCYGTGSRASCSVTGRCWQKDDLNQIIDRIRDADALVFATPVYFYSVSGQLKVFFDRSIQLYARENPFHDIYLIAASEAEERSAMDGAIQAVQGWIACMPGTHLEGVVYGTGCLAPGDVRQKNAMHEAEEMGKHAAERIVR